MSNYLDKVQAEYERPSSTLDRCLNDLGATEEDRLNRAADAVARKVIEERRRFRALVVTRGVAFLLFLVLLGVLCIAIDLYGAGAAWLVAWGALCAWLTTILLTTDVNKW